MDFGTERWVDAGDVPLFVRSWGGDGGRDVLYWHGVGLSSQGSLKLADAAPQLARKHGLRVLALDAPGFGRSPARDPDSYHPHALADLVPPLLDGLGLTRVLFMGFSWGGDLGCHVAARHPRQASQGSSFDRPHCRRVARRELGGLVGRDLLADLLQRAADQA